MIKKYRNGTAKETICSSILKLLETSKQVLARLSVTSIPCFSCHSFNTRTGAGKKAKTASLKCLDCGGVRWLTPVETKKLNQYQQFGQQLTIPGVGGAL